MKTYFLIFICISSYLFSNAQVSNDDCSTATDLGLFPASIGPSCQSGHAPYNGYINYLLGATPSNPYYYMSGCKGYDTVTTSFADDIWYKYGGSYSSETKVLIGGGFDTLHLNFYHGIDCNNLQASGCFTYIPAYGDTVIKIYSEQNPTTSTNYIQISSNIPGKVFYSYTCIDQPIPSFFSYYGNIHVNNPTNILNNQLKRIDLNIIPNPNSGKFKLEFNSSVHKGLVEIIDITGRIIYNEKLELNKTNYQITLPKEISNGIYNCTITSDYARESKKIVVVKQ